MSTDTLEYGPPASPEEEAALTRILAWSFAAPQERLTKAWAKIGVENLRIQREKGRVVSGYILHSMGQWFGGRRVSMAGVGMVGVAAEARGHGLATRLMDDSIREFHAKGFALSALYPAKQVLYRRSGYERAGGRYFVEIDLAKLALADRVSPLGTVRPATPEDLPTLRALHEKFVSAENGPVDRNAFLWERCMSPPDQDMRGYFVDGENGPEGYTFLYQERKGGIRPVFHVTDHVALTPRAARTLLSLYADHRSMGLTIDWYGRFADPLLMLLAEARLEVQLSFPWMIRIVDVARAFAERGFPTGIETEIHFEVKDELIPSNAGRWTLRVANGRGEATRGGEGRIVTGVHGLASIYSSFLSPRVAQISGLLDGPPEELARAALAFAGPAPWMPDMF